MHRLSRSTLASLAGLLVGVAGLVVQWIADPAKFAGDPFPPGIAFILGSGLLMLLTARWWWHPVFGVLIALWIVVGGTLARKMIPNLTSHDLGTVVGTAVMSVGLLLTAVTGVLGMIAGRRTRQAAQGWTPGTGPGQPDRG